LRYIKEVMSIARYEKRMIGWLIDKLISLGALAGVLTVEILYLPKDFSLFLEILIATIAGYAFYVLTVSLYLFFGNGYTLGMQLMGIRTYHATKDHIRFYEAYLKAMMTGFTAMDLINSIYMLSSHTERSVFDRLTNTLVVDVRAER
jgi:uncharacterized RDD family membrane protein YckC